MKIIISDTKINLRSLLERTLRLFFDKKPVKGIKKITTPNNKL